MIALMIDAEFSTQAVIVKLKVSYHDREDGRREGVGRGKRETAWKRGEGKRGRGEKGGGEEGGGKEGGGKEGGRERGGRGRGERGRGGRGRGGSLEPNFLFQNCETESRMKRLGLRLGGGGVETAPSYL